MRAQGKLDQYQIERGDMAVLNESNESSELENDEEEIYKDIKELSPK